jgi:hypothetical protein
MNNMPQSCRNFLAYGDIISFFYHTDEEGTSSVVMLVLRGAHGSSAEVRRIRAFIFKQAGLFLALREMKPALQCTEQYLSL